MVVKLKKKRSNLFTLFMKNVLAFRIKAKKKPEISPMHYYLPGNAKKLDKCSVEFHKLSHWRRVRLGPADQI